MLSILNKKTKEHEFEVQSSLVELDKMLKMKKDVTLLQQIMILKDKIMFHKGAVMVLEDLKKEIANEDSKT